jgi:hypothetical protein
MLSRALSLATVTLLIGCLTAVGVRAVENLEAGKSPSQIFAGTCSACHKSPRGLLRGVSASSLPGFLRQHYTTSGDMASVLASFLVANGAADTRFQAKQGKDAAKDGKQQEAARPSDQPAEPRNVKRLPRPGETPDVMRPDGGAVQAAIDAKQGVKQKQGKKGRPGDEAPKVEEPAKTEPPAEAPKIETVKGDDSAKPEAKTETAKVDAAKDAAKDAGENVGGEPALTRPDPVPAVTPAHDATAAAPTASTTIPNAPLDAATGLSFAPPTEAAQPDAAAVAAAPSLPPVPPAGPPAPPISQ